MTLKELLSKELRCQYEVWLEHNDTLEEDKLLFDSFFNVDDVEECTKWRDNYHTYGDYEVVYFYARSTQEVIRAPFNAYVKIIIKKPVNVEELPF